jgi:hypothetical protein
VYLEGKIFSCCEAQKEDTHSRTRKCTQFKEKALRRLVMQRKDKKELWYEAAAGVVDG